MQPYLSMFWKFSKGILQDQKVSKTQRGLHTLMNEICVCLSVFLGIFKLPHVRGGEVPFLLQPGSTSSWHWYVCYWYKFLGIKVVKIRMCQHPHTQNKQNIEAMKAPGLRHHPCSMVQNEPLSLSLSCFHWGKRRKLTKSSSLRCQENQMKYRQPNIVLYYLLVLF